MALMRMERDRVGRGAGIIVFIVGVVLLLAVFYLAYLELIGSGVLWGGPPGTPGRSALEVSLLVASKGLFLFMMALVASAVANKGIALYQATGNVGG